MALRGSLWRVVSVGLIAGVASVLGACGVNEKDYNALKAENEDLRQRVATSEGQLRDKDAQIAAAEARTKDVEKQPMVYPTDGGTRGNQGPRGDRGRGDVVLEVAGDVLFASGQTTLRADAKKELDRIVRTLNSQYSGHYIRVEGYTDTDQPKKGKYKTNEALSEARAEAVRSYLVSKGISSNMISAVGMGSAKPKSSKNASRRVEIVVLGN